jgi:hypothetical protein
MLVEHQAQASRENSIFKIAKVSKSNTIFVTKYFAILNRGVKMWVVVSLYHANMII